MGPGFDRRTFLKLLGVGTGASLLPACTDAPVEHLYAYLKPPAEHTPGVATWYASVCRDCPVGCGLSVRTREGRPVKLEGHPGSPVNSGALCLRGQSALQALYDPDRHTTVRMGKPGSLQEATGSRAIGRIAESLKRAEGAVGLLTGAQTATGASFYGHLAERLGASWVAYEPVQFAALKKASALLFSRNEVPRFDLSAVDFILNLGADVIESWLSPVEHARQLAERHGFAGTTRAPHICLSPRRDLTAAGADAWIPIRPETAGVVSLALAGKLLPDSELPAAEKEKLAGWLAPYDLANAARRAGCAPGRLARLAARLRRARRAVALPPAETLLGTEATFEQAAVLVLNRVLGATDTVVRYGQSLPWSHMQPARELEELLTRAADGELSVLLLVDSNPVYDWPDGDLARKALERVPLTVQIAGRPDETTPVADVVLPGCHFLQTWGDHQVRADWMALGQPLLELAGQQRQAEDWLIAVAAAAGAALPWTDFRQCLAQHWAGIGRELAPGSDATAFFREAQARGGQALPEPVATPTTLEAEALPAGGQNHHKKTAASNPKLLLYASGRLYDGRTANRPWIQEAPDALTQTVWDTPVEISPALARRLKLVSGDRVEVTGAGGQVTATVRVLPGAREDVAAMPLGGGRHNAGRIASGRGARGWSLLKPVLDPLGGGLAAVQTTVSLRKVSSGRLLTVEGDPSTHGRPIVPVVSLTDALRGRYPKQTLHGTVMVDVETGEIVGGDDGHMTEKLEKIRKRKAGKRPPKSFYPDHDYPEHMWGMTVDLDLCNGCGACVIACQAENNVGTVGPDQIPLGREMHWIRIERYWTGATDGQGPLPRFLPVMCQHCENAPCEPVCPVFASYHTRDGLNAQIYNRCIGTRYCANNCPYKARRFNWFDYQWPRPLDEQLNPDVTVRSKGVMEKCTFCVQRIREKTNLAKAAGREVAEGEIVPACVQTCPTGALRFGDRLREGSAVSRLAGDPRAYRLLDYYLANGPAVSYLCKVTRPEDA